MANSGLTLDAISRRECAAWSAGLRRSSLECVFCDPLWTRQALTADMGGIWEALVEHLASVHGVVPDPAQPPLAQTGTSTPSSWG